MNIIISKNEKNPEVIVDFDCFPTAKEKGKHLFTMLLRKYPKDLFVKDGEEVSYKNIFKNVTNKTLDMKLIKRIMKDKTVMATFDENIDSIIKAIFNSTIYTLDRKETIYLTRNIAAGTVHELIIKEEYNKKTRETEFAVSDQGICKIMEKYPDYMYGYELEK